MYFNIKEKLNRIKQIIWNYRLVAKQSNLTWKKFIKSLNLNGKSL